MGFYAYLWLREDGTPYYAGKGSGQRAFVRRENHWPPADHTRILIFDRASEVEAFATEKELIANWGRKDIGTGCLQNRTDGGDNPPRAKKGRKLSLAARHNMSLARIGKPNLKARGLKRSDETKQRMSKPRSSPWVLSAATKQKMQAAAIVREAEKKEQGIHRGQIFGYRHTEEARQKISNAKRGKPSWNKGIPLTVEHRIKLSAVRKGKKRGPYSKKGITSWLSETSNQT